MEQKDAGRMEGFQVMGGVIGSVYFVCDREREMEGEKEMGD